MPSKKWYICAAFEIDGGEYWERTGTFSEILQLANDWQSDPAFLTMTVKYLPTNKLFRELCV